MAKLLLVILGFVAGPVLGSEFPLAPDIHGEPWLNSEPMESSQMRGHVVLLEFWTYGCRNCRNVEPQLKRWHSSYASRGLLVLAVHSPEFPHEARLENVKRYVRDNGVLYPVPVDRDFVTWKRFGNRAWPALYLIDKSGRIRYTHVGEGAYAATETAIRSLLAEPGPLTPATGAGRRSGNSLQSGKVAR